MKNNIYDLSNYDYKLDKNLIAQKPLKKRDSSRLLVLDKKTGKITHTHFYNIDAYLNLHDCLVINNTKVLPARLYGYTKKTNAKIEILLLDKQKGNTWDVMMKNSKRVKENDTVLFPSNIKLKLIRKKGKLAEVSFNFNEKELTNKLRKTGFMPLPPYIKKEITARSHAKSYQTIYAKNEGAKAAPTAGFHFTEKLIKTIEKKGIKKAPVTLHVGFGTFEAISEKDIRKHKMHTEYYNISRSSAITLNSAIKKEKRIIAVGTTSLRTLESAVCKNHFKETTDKTCIYLYPGYDFKIVDALITNFHLPKTTLFALVCAFGGMNNIKNAYKQAVALQYRFFSYGDAMLIK